MVDGFYKLLVKLLIEHGYVFHAAAKGSHEKWRNPASGVAVIVPRNLFSRHTANGILKDAGIDRRF
jgi:predicted RNA binding protein YcfA (HicA-like mRNA interferase family)